MTLDIFDEEQRIYDEAVARVAAVRGGAAFDFEEYARMTKEYGRLLKQLRRSTRIADRTASGLFESNLDLTDKANVDGLTGIYNRRYMDKAMSRLIRAISRADGGKFGVLMIDVDYFKKYNDTYGHAAGDDCLRRVAKVIGGVITREDDFAARYGGEEFAVILPNTDERGAGKIAGRILENVRELNIPHEKNEAANHVTVSVGGTACAAEYSHSGADYIKRADEALYLSKHNGRNQYTFLNFEGGKV